MISARLVRPRNHFPIADFLHRVARIGVRLPLCTDLFLLPPEAPIFLFPSREPKSAASDLLCASFSHESAYLPPDFVLCVRFSATKSILDLSAPRLQPCRFFARVETPKSVQASVSPFWVRFSLV
jgi:hypothetical protein